MLKIIPNFEIPLSEIKFRFMTASGPGGQNVNKVATAVLLRFDVSHSPFIPDDIRKRLLIRLNKRLTREGELIIKAGRFRTQERNKQDAITRLVELLRKAAIPPKKRIKTKPSPTSIQRRLNHKKSQAKKKILRRIINHENE